MAVIFSIDTSTTVCSVAVHEDGQLIGQQSYHLQKSHSSLLPEIVKQLMENSEITLSDLDAIAISEGPGSYTGLRIGTATAKGLAFSLNLPLIAINSLDSMLEQVVPFFGESALYCPMIDARRMEVYCKLVESEGNELWNTRPVIVDEETFHEFTGQRIVMFGNGSAKLKKLFTTSHFFFIENVHPSASFMGAIAYRKFLEKNFVDMAYFEPEYLKEFKTNVPTQKAKP